ncbi:LysR substrate-binding domain-containing protein [Enterovibrio baiacu]|uniref:LysR substrate-binding domain-containing protein n=1 Tax=Enterovibrio baiacu TaxID=2491023 RepID=UPI003D150EE5
MRLPNLNSLRIFETVARHGNVRIAAEELNLTPSAVAQRIRRLEEELDHVLFLREARGVSLTEGGKVLFGEVARSLSILNHAVKTLSDVGQSVLMSVPPSFGVKWLIPRLGQFQEHHPDIDLRLSSSEAVSNFFADDVDFVVRFGIPPFGDELEWHLLSPVNLKIVYNPLYLESHPPLTGNNDFTGHQLIDDSHQNWTKVIGKQNGAKLGKTLNMYQTGLAIDAALSGQGLCISPFVLVSSYVSQGDMVVLGDVPAPEHQGFYLVYPKGRQFSAEKRCVMEWLRQEITAGT